MNARSFLIAAAIYVLLTVFIFFNYPEAWRKNRVFLAAVILWRAVGLSAVVIIFTVFRDIPNEGVRYAIARIGSCYYITTTVQALLYFIRFVSSRTYRFIAARTGRTIRPQGERWLSDKRSHAIVFIALSFAMFFLGYSHIDDLRDTRYAVAVEAPAAEKELNICLISDIHAGAGTWEDTYDDMAALIDASASDVLLIAGDAFDETTSQTDIEHLARALAEIGPPRYGMYFVYGDHHLRRFRLGLSLQMARRQRGRQHPRDIPSGGGGINETGEMGSEAFHAAGRPRRDRVGDPDNEDHAAG